MANARRRVLVIGLDGLRPDVFDPELMPTIANLVNGGVRMTDHHASYPTHTRVNISTLASGTYPGKHGIVANVFQLAGDSPDTATVVDTSNDAQLREIDAAPIGPAVLRPTLGDILEQHDERVAVAATSTAGAAILWTRNQPYRVVNTNSYYDRADLLSLREKLGPVPPSGPDYLLERQMYAGRAVTDIFLSDEETRVIVLWLNEPDLSQHIFGLGSLEVRQALEVCDEVVGYVLEKMERAGVRDQFDIMVVSDHGHSSVRHNRSLAEYLDRAHRELRVNGQAPRTRTASDYVYFPSDAEAGEAARLVHWIQEQPWAGAVFGSGPYADLPGVLRLEDVWAGVGNSRSPSLAISPAWFDDENEAGTPGVVAALTEQVALRSTHGSASPYDMHAFLASSGPSFLEHHTSNLPTGAIDLTPTILQLLGHEPEDEFDGRVLWEALAVQDGDTGDHATESIRPQTRHIDGFEPELVLERVGPSCYVDRATNGRRR